MNNYSVISVIAMFCYLFLFVAFMAAHKNKIINSFLLVLAGFLFWTGGSYFMRMELWPGSEFWFHISLVGLFFLPFTFFNFVHAMVGAKKDGLWKLWLSMAAVNCIVNTRYGFYIPFPEVTRLGNGTAAFTYHIGWPIVLLFLMAAGPVSHMFYLVVSTYKRNTVERRQFDPIFMGIGILFIGHLGPMIPALHGFPTDVVSGIINAGFMFYALYKKRLFRLTLLISRGVVYTVTTLLVALLFANSINPMEEFIVKTMQAFQNNSILILAVFFTLVTFFISSLLKSFIDILFAKEEMVQSEHLKDFSSAVAKSLQMEDIVERIVSVIQACVEVEKIYVCLEDLHGAEYELVHLSRPLDGASFSIKKDNPAVKWLMQNRKCMLVSEFKRTTLYKSMWEEEKASLKDLDVQCILPLMDEQNLVGMVLLTSKKRGRKYGYDDLSFLESVSSISAIAVSNSRLYKKAYMEARIDELTGLLNRKYFYEILNRLYEYEGKREISLIIFNIDDFKLYNQLYGTKEGDVALQNVAKIIKSTVGEAGYVSRYSGKEFAVLLPDFDVLAARTMAESIRRQIIDMNKKGKDYALKVLTVSCGICSIPYSAGNTKQLVENADMAVYTVKRRGKNGVLVFDVGSHIEGQQAFSSHMAKEEVYSSYHATIFALTAAIDTKDHYTFSHSNNVASYACSLAKACGMNSDFVELVREAALLHDVGKIGVPEHILNKPGRLKEEEYEIMKTHVENSIGIIRNLPSLDYVIPAVIGHHERYDGRGYPRGIAGEDIPLSARILCIADSFDAMISKRSYKDSFPLEYALEELINKAGTQFDPVLAPLFVEQVKNGTIEPIYGEESKGI